MNQHQKGQLFHYGFKILALKNQIRFYKNMLYYTNLERDRLFAEIKKHNKEFELYSKLQNGIKIDTTIYSNLSALLECEKVERDYKSKINKIENEIKKCKKLQNLIITGKNEKESDLDKIFKK